MNFSEIKSYRSQTKLMISGEYLVLKGALALALPLKFKQEISISEQSGIPSLRWKSLVNNNLWFQATLLLPDLQIIETNEVNLAGTLQKILKAAKLLNFSFLGSSCKYQVTSTMDFDPAWGIGSSSSLIFIINQVNVWPGINGIKQIQTRSFTEVFNFFNNMQGIRP